MQPVQASTLMMTTMRAEKHGALIMMTSTDVVGIPEENELNP
jgi:hypothetical protein